MEERRANEKLFAELEKLDLRDEIDDFLREGFIELDDDDQYNFLEDDEDGNDNDNYTFDLADDIGYRKYRREKRIAGTTRARMRQKRKTTYVFGPASSIGKCWQFHKACRYYRMDREPNPKRDLDNEEPMSYWHGQLTALDQIEVFGKDHFEAYPSESEAEFFSHYSDEEEEKDLTIHDDNMMRGSSLSETLAKRDKMIGGRFSKIRRILIPMPTIPIQKYDLQYRMTDEDTLFIGHKFGG